MPTAPKLIAAVAFFALIYFVSDLIRPQLPEGTPAFWLSPVNAFFGLLMGWRILGARAGDGLVPSLGYGLTAAAATVFWGLLVWAGYEMVIRSMRLYYDGPTEALQDMASLMLEYGQLAATPETVGALIVGSLLVAWLTEFFAARWS